MAHSGLHDAFKCVPILENLPLTIESIATYGTRLLLGTSKGHLLIYEVKPGTGIERFVVTLPESKKSFASKPITQLTPIPELGLLISLTGGTINVHDLSTLMLRSQVKTRSASFYSIDIKPVEMDQGRPELRMVVGSRKKCIIYEWRLIGGSGEFVECKVLDLPADPKSIVWAGEQLCVGFKKEYCLVHADTGMITELFPTGRLGDPLAICLPGDELLLEKDLTSIFISSHEGRPTRTYGLLWGDTPTNLALFMPYVLGLLSKTVEVRTVETQFLMQIIHLRMVRYVAIEDAVYLASSNFVWRLVPVRLEIQIQQLLAQNQYEEALSLAQRIPNDEPDRESQLRHIQTLHAHALFVQHRFERSLKLFEELGVDPPNVIGLFPNLLPKELRAKFSFPMEIPEIIGIELDKAMSALTDFLTTWRTENSKRIQGEHESNLSDQQRRATAELSQIVDTTLLKCYLTCNPKLVISLLRVDNKCHIQESEKMLKKAEMWPELVALYQAKGLHNDALKLLVSKGRDRTGGPLSGVEKTVAYLQRLGKEHMQLITNYSTWVLQTDPVAGLSIFTDELYKEVKELPRHDVLAHLEKVAARLVVPYLEYVILECEDSSTEFHNRLVRAYLDIVLDSTAKNNEDAEVRAKLLTLLESSKHYTATAILPRLPDNFLFEERALLLGRIHQHEQALNIYAHKLKDPVKAEAYCEKYYRATSEDSRDVYLFLLRAYLAPTASTEPMIEPAMCLLAGYHTRIDTARALAMLPAETPVSALLPYIEAVMRETSESRRTKQILKSLLKSEHLQVQEQIMQFREQRIVVTEERICSQCSKRLTDSAIVNFPDGRIVHYACWRQFENVASEYNRMERGY